MSKTTKIAFVLFFLTFLAVLAFGFAYLLMPTFMPYHRVAIGQEWSALAPEMRVLILGFMKLSAAGMLSTAVAGGMLLFIPFRRGENWARYALLTIGLVEMLLAIYAVVLIQINTPASPPLSAVIAGVMVLLIAFALSHDLARGK